MGEEEIQQLIEQYLQERSYPKHIHNGLDFPIIDKDANGLNFTIDTLLPTQTGNSGKFLTTDGSAASWGTVTDSSIISITAADDITAGQAVAVGDGSSTYLKASQTTYDTSRTIGSPGSDWVGQIITTSATAKKLYGVIANLSSGFSNINIGIYIRATSGGLPTGVNLATGIVTLSTPNGEVSIGFTPITVTPNTQYAVLYNADKGVSVKINSAGGYSGGTVVTSSNSGNSWTAQSGEDMYFKAYEIDTIAGEISTTSTAIAGDLASNFIGFATANITAGNAGSVKILGKVTGLSGLTPGVTYYLQDTAGTIGTSAGSISRKIGLAISATELLIKHDNP